MDKGEVCEALRISNVEYRMSNVECRASGNEKKTEVLRVKHLSRLIADLDIGVKF